MRTICSLKYEVVYDNNAGIVYHKKFLLYWSAWLFFRKCQKNAPQGCGDLASLSEGDSTIMNSYEGGCA